MGAIMPQTLERFEPIFRRESGQVLATLIGVVGDFDLAEDALQDALVAALERWPVDGLPVNPGGWLTTTARRKAIDRARRNVAYAQKQAELQIEALREQSAFPERDDDHIPDERLKLLFTCCHPALALEARVALTLRMLGGLSTAEIAHAFLVPLPTMAQRLTRAKTKIRQAGIPYQVPSLEVLPERVNGLLAVIYLIFNAGYAAPIGEALIRHDLCAESIRLARVLRELLARDLHPDAEVTGLLALMLLHDARREARVGADGDLILLEAQDRARWDHVAIAEGTALIEESLHLGRLGSYQVQAMIAGLHSLAERADQTDWPQIAALYGVLLRITPTPVIALNRAVAIAMAEGPSAGLAIIDTPNLADALQTYHFYHAARADLLRRLERDDEAAVAYQKAIDCCENGPEREFLERRLTSLIPTPQR